MKNQINPSPALRPKSKEDLTIYFINELENLSLKILKSRLTKLNYLASTFDPYQIGLGTSREVGNIIKEFKLKDFTHNPFEFTNILLRMIDLTTEQINKRQH